MIFSKIQYLKLHYKKNNSLAYIIINYAISIIDFSKLHLIL